jgi:predicted lactoylglutathione lyase
MTTAESADIDIRTALSAAIEALGDVMLEMQRRELLARTVADTKEREMLSSNAMTDEQIGDLSARAFEAGARLLAKVGSPGSAGFSCNLSDLDP